MSLLGCGISSVPAPAGAGLASRSRRAAATSARAPAIYCIMFGSDYIELLGIVDPNDFVQNLDAFLVAREGVIGGAFAPAASAETVRAALLHLHPLKRVPSGGRSSCRRAPLRSASADFAAAGRDPGARLFHLRQTDPRAGAAAGMARPCDGVVGSKPSTWWSEEARRRCCRYDRLVRNSAGDDDRHPSPRSCWAPPHRV